MTDMANLRELMIETGELDDNILEVLQTSDDSFAVRYEDVDVELEFDADMGRIGLTTEIAIAPPERELEIYRTLLNYSLLWRETGGVHMALAGPGGPAMQMVELDADGMAAQPLATILSNLVERTIVWRAFFASDEAAPPTFDQHLFPVGLRV